MSSSHGALVVFGSGPGVGRSTAALFAERGFEKVVLISRNADRLAQDAAFVCSARAETSVYEIAADVGDAKDVQRSLQRVEEVLEGTPLEFVLFNAARTGKSEFFKFEPADLENDLKVRWGCVPASRLLKKHISQVLTPPPHRSPSSACTPWLSGQCPGCCTQRLRAARRLRRCW